MRLLLLILLLLSGYLEAKEVVLAKVKPGGSTDAAFNLYTMYFELKTNVSVARVPIVFANLPRGMSGVCLRWTNGRRKILVDKHIWYKMFTFEQKMQLIWHELGHCRLEIKHSHKVGTDGCPTSLMYTHAISQKCSKKWAKVYLKRFLTGEGE